MGRDERVVYRFSSIAPLIVISDEIIEERKEQILLLKRELINYRVILKDLALMEVPYSIKNELLNIAFFIVQDVEILNNFKSKKNIPMSVVAKEFGKTRRYLEEWRDNIVTYVVILSDPKYKHIQDYLRVIEDEEKDIDVNALSILKNNKDIKGIVISSRKKNAMIMTSMGDLVKIKTNDIVSIGEEVSGTPKKLLRDYKFHISMLVAIFLVLIGMTIFRYTKVVSTVMVGTTSNIVLEVNSFNRIKNIYSRTERGSKMVETIDVLDKGIDHAIYSIIKYANENDMMPQTGIIVTVNGKPIKYGLLSKTEDYIYLEQIDFKLNNSGIEQNF
ncbi:anti-sigma factor domain-containing protein [Clostridium disporicum]|jgi:hypothetical protein|uniref:Putative RNA polymerase sigma factor SigI n=1 Tax=Clostridium disporicum TaxID=84024 RepID=A0A174HVE9_9CLOT|nr:anti-sigma factor domain-containing protein [Clostridium disporicum]CUO77118.1 putative RNA polymerase sigma factor SigI [Clostridium disporicum]